MNAPVPGGSRHHKPLEGLPELARLLHKKLFRWADFQGGAVPGTPLNRCNLVYQGCLRTCQQTPKDDFQGVLILGSPWNSTFRVNVDFQGVLVLGTPWNRSNLFYQGCLRKWQQTLKHDFQGVLVLGTPWKSTFHVNVDFQGVQVFSTPWNRSNLVYQGCLRTWQQTLKHDFQGVLVLGTPWNRSNLVYRGCLRKGQQTNPLPSRP